MIDVKELAKQVALVAARHPQGQNCGYAYFDEDGEACDIIGRALADLGLHDDVAPEDNTTPITFLYCGTSRHKDFLTVVQGLTDEGSEWLPAVIQASRVLLNTKE